MSFLYNKKSFKERRRSLRKSQTEAERKIWSILRNKQFHGLKFFRQYSVGDYILDFYCPFMRLAIEVDGSQHIENKYDEYRTSCLKKNNILVLRFWNNEVLGNIEGVCLKLEETIKDITPPNLPLYKGEEMKRKNE